MKNIAFVIICITFLAFKGAAQCTPDTTLTQPGFYPLPDQLECVEQTVLYDEVVQVTLPGTVTVPLIGSATLISLQITSITGFPTGISYTCNPANCTFPGGTTSCIEINGTTTDTAGQYTLDISGTANTNFGSFPVTSSQLASLGISYYLTVINQGATCPNAAVIAVNIAGNTTICSGQSTTLTANVTDSTGTVNYMWSGGQTTKSITVSPTANTPYSVTVTDQNGSATGNATVTVNQIPVADFTVTATTGDATFTNTSTDATTYSWNFDDGDTSAAQNPTHTYTANGTYDITLIASNSCGSDTATESVTITGVFISPAANQLSFKIAPNPASEKVSISFSTETSGTYDVKVLDLTGKVVMAEKISSTSNAVRKDLNVSSLPKGIYNIQLISEKGFGVKGLVIE